MTPRDFVSHLIPGPLKPVREEGRAFAPANIALVKYWGKRDPLLNLPVTSSLSVSLAPLGATTSIRPAERDEVALDGVPVDGDQPFARRLFAFLDLFRTPDAPAWSVQTASSIPVGAGLASSASGFAALVKALDDLYGWGGDARTLSLLARLGSGSACRSLFPGFAYWHAGRREDGLDSFAEGLPEPWPDLCVGLVILEAGPKPINSREGMNRTVETSALYRAWPDLVLDHLNLMRKALVERDLAVLGETAEGNALAMHATMIAAQPPVVYWTPKSLEAMRTVWALRAEGVPVYFTMDAGPNLKLLFEEAQVQILEKAFPGLRTVRPFGPGA